jgi:epoxyqueuosine reductase
MASGEHEAWLKERGAALGFDEVRIARADAIPRAGERLAAFLAEGRHGTMTWLAANAERRGSPAGLWPQSRSVVVVAMSYAPERDPLVDLEEKSCGSISAYARRRDYHDVLKGRLKELAQGFAHASGAEVKVFVDTAPVMEKPLAEAAGIGWQGKHTNLVSRRHGSWLFLGVMMTTADLVPDDHETGGCGSCTRCLDICPTAAFPAPYQLDARRCLAYLTIEHKGTIAREFRAALGNRVFGCDDCLAVCPWNKFAATAREMKLAVRAETDLPPLAELLALDDAAFRARFSGTPVKRTGRDRVVRNAAIAAGNSGDVSLIPALAARLADNSPLVRAMAVWALRRLAGDHRIAPLRCQHLASEADADVIAEWNFEDTE